MNVRSALAQPASLLLLMPPLLAGCGEDAPQAQAAGQGVPQDAALAQLYGASCKQCHANPAAGAPLTNWALTWAASSRTACLSSPPLTCFRFEFSTYRRYHTVPRK